MNTFLEYKVALKGLFAKIPGKISLTSDLWTSNQKLGYMVITAHYISSDWVLQKRIISFPMIPSPHTGQAIYEALYAQLLSWEITEKIQSLTLDNATNNDSAVSLLKNALFDVDDVRRDLLQLRCNAHVMNLVVKDGLDHVNSSIENIQKSVIHVSSSAARLQKFHETCDLMSIKRKTLPIDVDNRWDSTFLMLEAAIPYKKVFDLYFSGSHFQNVPTLIDWKNAIAISEFLGIFCETTKLFSGTKYVTSTHFCYQISKIAICMNKYSKIPAFKAMHADMKSKFDKYWKEVPLVLGLASCMDPRFKLSALDLCLDLNKDPPPQCAQPEIVSQPELDVPIYTSLPPTTRRVRQRVLPVKNLKFYEEKLAELFEVYQRKMKTDFMSTAEDASDVEDEDVVFELLSQRREAAVQTCKSDLQRYLDEPALKVKKNNEFDILKWWKEHEGTYPVLSAMARDLLAIPISSVPSESAFSGSERIISKNRSCLSADTVEALVCLGDWYKAEKGLQDEDVEDITELMAGVRF